ncbi:hypothetical protein BH11ARM2_BH11ARM2_13290 [soil metagenome]
MRVWIEAGVVLGFFFLMGAAFAALRNRIVAPWLTKYEGSSWTVLLRPVHTLVVWALILMGINGAAVRLEGLLTQEGYWPLIARALGLAWVLLFVVGAIRSLGALFSFRENVELRATNDPLLQRNFRDRNAFARKLATGIVAGVGIVYSLRALGVDTSPLLAGGAVGGVVIGLALQDSLSNIFAGLFLNLDRPATVGDLISLGPDKEGTIEEIGWRYTKIRLLSDNLLIVPNKSFASTEIVNYDRPYEQTNIYVDVGVAYGSDLAKVERVAIEAGNAAQKSSNDPPLEFRPYVRFRNLGDSAITVRIFVRSSSPRGRFLLSSSLVREIHDKFREAGIDIPFPTSTIFYSVRNEKATDGAPSQRLSES